MSINGRCHIAACALGIDVGLSGVRAAVLAVDGRLLGRARRSVETGRPEPGRAEHDPAAWLEATLATGAEAVARAGGPAIEAIGVGALGPAPLIVDESLTPLTPALLFSLDTRAEKQRAALADEVTHDHALPKLLWLAEHDPEAAQRAFLALDATGFLVTRLTGVPTMDTVTAADYRHGSDMGPFALPTPVDPFAVVGGVTAPVGTALGIAEGTPVAAGSYDTYVDVAGAGVRRPGDGCLLLGSTLAVCVSVGEEVDCPGLELTRYPGEGFLLGGWTAAGGTVLDWAGELVDDADAIAGAASLPPGSGGLLALPYLAGERTPVRDPTARGLLLGLTLQSGRGQVYRAFLDALALSARDHVERLAEAGVAPARWLCSGGGRRNGAGAQGPADALAAPLDCLAHAGEAVGPAILALRAVGYEPVRPVERTLEPDPGAAARYDELYPLYRELHPLLGRTMHELAALDGARRGR